MTGNDGRYSKKLLYYQHIADSSAHDREKCIMLPFVQYNNDHHGDGFRIP